MATNVSDTGDNSALFNLLINADPAQADEILAQFNSFIEAGDGAAEAIAKINVSAQSAAEGIDKVTVQVEALKTAIEEPATLPEEAYLKSLPQQVEQATVAVKSMREQLAGAAEQTVQVNALFAEMRAGGGESGGVLPPTEDGAGGGAEMPPIGSQFAVGHALTAAGRTIGAPALTEAGAFVYMEEGLRKIQPLFEQLNQTIEASPGLLEPLIGALSGMGIPMAGLLAVAGPLVIALGGAALAISAFSSELAKEKEIMDGVIKGLDTYFSSMYSMTTDQAQKALDDMSSKTAQAAKERDFLRSKLPEGVDENSITVASPATQAIIDRIKALNKEIDQNQINSDALTSAMQDGSLAANDATEAAKKEAQAKVDAAKAISDASNKEYADSQLNLDALKKRAELLKNNIDNDQLELSHLKALGDESPVVQNRIAVLEASLKTNGAEWENLNNILIPAAEHTKEIADAIKMIGDAAKESAKSWEKYFAAYQSAQDQLASQRANAISKEKEQEAVLTQGSLEDTQARTRISIEEGRKVTTIVNDTANAIVDIRTKMGQQDLAAQIDYNRKLMDDQTKYQEQQQTDWTNMYRKETDNLTAHQQKLADIQAKQSNDQQSALLNRNFLQLAQQAQSKQTEIDAENTAYARKQAAEQTAYQRQLEDLARHYAETRTQDFVNYQRKLTDDQLHARQEIQQKEVDEQRKLQVARTWEQQALADLTQNEQYKISILRQGLAQELVLYQQQAAAKLAIAAREAAGSSFPSGLPGMPGTGGMHVGGGFGFKDTGGPFAAGETFMKGDISEMFTFGGQSYSIPGAAIVHPLQGGTATPTSGGHQFNIPITINQKSGQDAALMASQEVYRRVKQMLGEV